MSTRRVYRSGDYLYERVAWLRDEARQAEADMQQLIEIVSDNRTAAENDAWALTR
jgi:hypothetical protein